MEAKTLEKYRKQHRRRAAARAQALERKRQRILAHLPKAVEILQRLGAQKIMAYGSILREGSFHEGSDLDLIAFGLPPEQWTAAFLQLEEIEEFEEIEIDLKLAEELPKSFLAKVELFKLA